MLLPVCILLIILLGLTITFALCEGAGAADRAKEQASLYKTELSEMWKYCDQHCYMCNLQNDCPKSAMKDVKK